MAKMTLEELRKLRDSKKSEIQKRDIAGKDTQIIIGMGTCGIAAGAVMAGNEFDSAKKNYIRLVRGNKGEAGRHRASRASGPANDRCRCRTARPR